MESSAGEPPGGAATPPGEAEAPTHRRSVAVASQAAVAGTHPMPDATKWHKHVIIGGLSAIGLRVVEQVLSTGTKVVVVDESAPDRYVAVVRSWGVPYVVGNARRRETLELAGVAGASALICMDDDDVFALELALLARAIRPDLRVIVQLGNEPVGQAVARVTGVGTVLDSAELAAPAFVDTLSGRRFCRISMKDLDLRVVDLHVAADGTVGDSAFGMIPVATLPRRSGPKICPSPGAPVSAGDVVVAVGTPAQLKAAGLAPDGREAGEPSSWLDRRIRGLRRARRGTIAGFLHGIFVGADRALKATFLAACMLVVLAVVVIRLSYRTPDGEPIDLVRAIYVTVQTVVTVGYGDLPFARQADWLILFDIALMLVGTFLFAIAFAQMTDLLISRRLATTLDIERATKMRGHTIIVGLSRVGVRVMQSLVETGHDVVIVDKNPDTRFAWSAREADVPVIIADATVPGTLAAANVAAASGAAVLTDDDLTNIETGLALKGEFEKQGRDAPVVLSLFDRYLSRTVETSFGFRDVRSTAQIAAPWFVAAALGLNIKAAFSVAKYNLLVGKLVVSPKGGLVGLGEADLGPEMRIIAHSRAGKTDTPIYPPDPNTLLQAGDRAVVVGTTDGLLRVLARNR